FSSKLYSGLLFGNKAGLYVKVEDYRLFTWKGYSADTDLSQLAAYEASHLSIQGDRGNTKFTILNLKFDYYLKKRYVFSLETSYYMRNSFYDYFPRVKYQIIESKIGAGYIF
ncbi:MAG: hypothetical protein LBL04_01770, partial [Bacteroidales bacterium]|nr:hypothetical protein [Bacteroidales bacterium]